MNVEYRYNIFCMITFKRSLTKLHTS